MLSKENRLSHTVFTQKPLTRRGFQYGSIAFFAIRPAKASVVVSKKIAKTAVLRNKIRRRVYHALKPVLKDLTKSIVVYPTLAAAKVPFDDLRNALAEAVSSR